MALRDHVTLRGFSSQRKSTAVDKAEQHFSTCQSFAKQQAGSSCTEPLCNLQSQHKPLTNHNMSGPGRRDAGSDTRHQQRRDLTHTQPGMHPTAADHVNTDEGSE